MYFECTGALFVAFMAATVGVLWWIALELHQLRKELKVEDYARNRSTENPGSYPQGNGNRPR